MTKNLTKPEKDSKTKTQSVKSLKTRITQKKDLNEKIAKLNARNNCAKGLQLADDCSTMSTSIKSKEAVPQKTKRRQRRDTIDFTELQNVADSVRKNIDLALNLNSRGQNSNIP